MGIGLNSLKYGVLYLGSHYNTGPYIKFPHFGNSNLGKLPYTRILATKCKFNRDSPAGVGFCACQGIGLRAKV